MSSQQTIFQFHFQMQFYCNHLLLTEYFLQPRHTIDLLDTSGITRYEHSYSDVCEHNSFIVKVGQNEKFHSQ